MASNGSIAEDLRRQVEDLATTMVMHSSPTAPEALRALSAALEDTRRQAAQAGWDEVAVLAAELRDTADAPGCGEDALREGIAKLQEAVDKKPAATPEAAPPAEQQLAAIVQDTDLLGDIIMESTEHLANVETQALTLEQDPDNAEAIGSMFRSFHTIKGLAGFMELNSIQKVAHETETALDYARNGQLRMTPAVIDVVLASRDYLQEAFRLLQSALGGQPVQAPPDNRSIIERVHALTPKEEEAAPEVKEPEKAPVLERPKDAPPKTTPREATPKAAPPAEAKEPAKAEQEAAAQNPQAEARMVKVDTSKLDFLVDMAGEMVIAQSQVSHDPNLKALESPRLQRNLAQLARITEELQKTAMSMRMVPVGQLFRRMPRLVRDLARKAGKQVELELIGEDTELDRTIVEGLSDPLVHMVRNSVDHGLETPEERKAAGKDPVGKVKLKACHQAGHIMIEVSDDGRGINRQKVLAKARQNGLIAEGAHPNENEILNLIFEPGFSTADKVTDVSGRGVGMDVVRKQLLKLRGRVDIQSVPNEGTTFFLKLPLTLAIIDGLVIGVGRERYIVPLFAVREILRPTREMISTACNRGEMVLIRGHLLPLIRLYRRFRVKPKTEDPCESVVLVAENGGKVFCLMVDEFTGKQEVVIKSLGETMKNIPGIAGGTILGDGRVGLVLDLDGVFEAGNG